MDYPKQKIPNLRAIHPKLNLKTEAPREAVHRRVDMVSVVGSPLSESVACLNGMLISTHVYRQEITIGSWTRSYVWRDRAMKVVLFCGGLGTRLREYSENVPKPLATIGHRPLLWHLMKYYAHFGHTEFILCLGYRGDLIREYFLNYQEAISNDFTLSDGGRHIEIHNRDLDGWKITFVDTGLNCNIGQRLLRARKYLLEERVFLANYADALSDLPFDRHLEAFLSHKTAVGSFAAVIGNQSFHFVTTDEQHVVTQVTSLRDRQLWINGGFFIFRSEIFDYINEGDELVEAPFARLVAQRKLMAYPWEGFWHCMDTPKDKMALDRMEADSTCQWKVWQQVSAAERRIARAPAPDLLSSNQERSRSSSAVAT